MSAESAVRSYLQQLQKVVTEDKRLADKRKLLSVEKKELESKIQDYIHKHDLPGIKFGTLTVIANQKKTRPRLKKSEKEAGGRRVLEELGISNSKEVLSEILDSMKGELFISPSISIKQNKDSTDIKTIYE